MNKPVSLEELESAIQLIARYEVESTFATIQKEWDEDEYLRDQVYKNGEDYTEFFEQEINFRLLDTNDVHEEISDKILKYVGEEVPRKRREYIGE